MEKKSEKKEIKAKKEAVEYKKYLKQKIGWTIGINFVINAFFGLAGKYINFFFTKYPDPTPTFGAISIATDTMWMAIYLGFFLAFFEVQETYEDILTRKLVTPPEWDRKSNIFLRFLPSNPFWRSVFFAFLTYAIFYPIALGFFAIFQIESMRFWYFVLFKGTYAGFMAMCISPINRLGALSDKKYTSGERNVKFFPLLASGFKIKRKKNENNENNENEKQMEENIN